MMKDAVKDTKRQPVFKVKTHIKAGYYLGLVVSAGGGAGAITSGPST
jgi:hypothetical protein